MGCPQKSIVYNGSLCACPAGQLFSSGRCLEFKEGPALSTDSGVDYYGVSFPETIFSFDSIKKFSQSQAVFLEATLVMVLTWLLMCLFLRFANLRDGRTIWFRIRWWITRLDICFATRHWLDDQKVVTKRKTELGGTFSIASWILFIGLFAALLYQIISKRTIEVHNFVDLPNNPASAVGFRFNFTAKHHADKKHLSFVSGTVKNGSAFDDTPVTFRGTGTNILKFNLFPRLYHNLHDLRLLQPLFHEFVPGSSFRETTQLRASLERSSDALLNTTLYINYLSAYIVEIENRSIIGPVSFLADLGGLYCFSIGIFFYLLVQCEYRIKKLRNEDSILRKIRNRRRAQERWDKLRKYVMYTWGCNTLVDDYKDTKNELTCSNLCSPSIRSLRKSGSSLNRRQQNSLDTICFHKKTSLPSEKNGTPDCSHTCEVECCVKVTEEKQSCLRDKPLQNPRVHGSANTWKKRMPSACGERASQPQKFASGDENIIPPPPPLVLKPESEVEMSDIQTNFKHLYDYNVMLREKLVAAQSSLHALAAKSSLPALESQTNLEL
ncbi:hypothetical protein Ddye_005217 [Dipteronia dyeriana]|uniref:Transmembrane protein n=1 Tax=Dipteronia dyeriana TaxID=168575 RepID=A0AAD9XFU7_9ROSI|nr:hypothetical protein Ddye_005217 [Dipteronia dyeriana]